MFVLELVPPPIDQKNTKKEYAVVELVTLQIDKKKQKEKDLHELYLIEKSELFCMAKFALNNSRDST